MRIDRVRINNKSHYYVDGERIGCDALTVIISGIYGQKVCGEIYRDAINNGFAVVEKYVDGVNDQLIEKLELANKKIAALERKVAELTIGNLYSKL